MAFSGVYEKVGACVWNPFWLVAFGLLIAFVPLLCFKVFKMACSGVCDRDDEEKKRKEKPESKLKKLEDLRAIKEQEEYFHFAEED